MLMNMLKLGNNLEVDMNKDINVLDIKLAGCVSCPKFPWCTLMPDECEADPISEDELKGEVNGTYSESLDW